MKMVKIVDWYEAGYLIVQGFKPGFMPREGHPQQLDTVFEWSTDLDRARVDFASNKGVPILSLRDAVKMVSAKNAQHRQAVLS